MLRVSSSVTYVLEAATKEREAFLMSTGEVTRKFSCVLAITGRGCLLTQLGR